MRRKARRTLDTALRLLDQGRLDDGVSRLYFAVFQAAVYGLGRMGREPEDAGRGRPYWRHRAVVREVASIRGRREDQRLIETLRRLRNVADYREGAAPRKKIEFLRHEATRFVDEVTR